MQNIRSEAVSHVMILDEDATHPPFSGAENHLLILMRGQVAAGLDVELIALIFRQGPVIEEEFAQLRACGARITVVRTVFATPGRFSVWVNVPQLLVRLRKLIRQRRDRVIHTHLFWTDLIAVLAARAAGHRCVITSIHNNPPHLAKGLLKYQYRMLQHFTTRYIAISSSVQRLLVDGVGLPTEKVPVVRYGLESPGPERSQSQLRAAYGIPADRYVVGFVGRLTPQKDLPSLLQAMRMLPEQYGVVVGFGELESELHAQARALELKNVQFLGHQPNGPELMRAFDVFCLPSTWEGLGLVLLEAMLREVPIIGSRSGAIPEILNHGEYGLLFEPSHTEQLVERIRFAAHNPDEMRAMAARALPYVQDNFTVEAMTRRTSDVYALAARGTSA